MRLLLISLNRETEPFTAAPLGLALVASALERSGHDVRALDLLFSEDPEREIADAVSGFRPEAVGISLRNIESSTEFLLPAYKDITDHIRRVTDVPVFIGGPGFSIMPAQVLEYLGLEYGIAGEGERAAPAFVGALTAGDDPASVPGVCTLRAGAFTAAPATPIDDLSECASPSWGMFPVNRYDMVGVQSKRGCSFSCVYCTYPSLEGRRMRLKPPDAVAREVGELVGRHGAEAFYFVDNVFNNPLSHAEAVCMELAALNTGAGWGALVSPIGMDERFASLMREAGCVSVEIGADSLSARSLAALGKSFRPGDVERAAAAAKSAGLMSMLFLILGGPGEDEDTLKETFDALERIKPDKVFAVSGVRIYPGTPLAASAVAEGVIAPDDNLLMPRFYTSAKLGERLYEIAGEFFGAHPDWIHYPARAVVQGAPPKPGKSAKAAWSDDAAACLDRILAEIPRLIRPIARKAVVREAVRLAAEKRLASITTVEVRDAFLSETPGPFRRSMEQSLRKSGLLDG